MAGNRFWNRWGFSREDGEARVTHVSLPPLGPNPRWSRCSGMQHPSIAVPSTPVDLSTPSTGLWTPSTGTPVSRAPTLPPMSRCGTSDSPWTPGPAIQRASFGMDRGQTPESSTISPNSYYMSMYPSPANTSGTPARRPGGTPSQYNRSPNRYALSPLWRDDLSDRMTPLPRNVAIHVEFGDDWAQRLKMVLCRPESKGAIVTDKSGCQLLQVEGHPGELHDVPPMQAFPLLVYLKAANAEVSPDPCLWEVFVLYASPVAKYAPIDFESEIDRIVCSARESERLQTGQVQVSVGVASSASLTKLLTLSHGRDAGSPALILHLAAHGYEAGGLILESAKGTGEAHPCSHEKLRSLLHSERNGENGGNGGLRGVSLLMLSSCSSKKLAQVFIDSGCQHVIATDRPVLDKTAKAFTERFYRALFVGKSIVDAFEHAKAALLASSHPEVAQQSHAYMLLKANEGDVPSTSAAGRSESWTIPERPWSRDSDIEGFQDACSFLDTLEFLPPRVEDFYRPSAMQYVLDTLRTRRACSVHGLKGIGKSALAIELSRFAASSGRLFSGNVLHVRLEEKGEALSTIKDAVDFFALRQHCMPFGRSDASCTVGQFRHLESRCGANAPMLLVLDDECNALESKPVKSLLAEVLRKTHRWKLLLCSAAPFRESLGFIKVVSVRLEGIDAWDSASLLLRRVHRCLEPKDLPESLGHQGRAREQLRQHSEATKLLVMSQLLAPLGGHPGLLCYVGSQVYDGGPSLRDVVQEVSSKDKEEVMAWLEHWVLC